jgi:hypothetical protein
MSVLSNSSLLPYRQYADAEVIQLYSADFTGQAGTLCTIQPANQQPGTEAGGFTTSAPLQAFTNVGNYAYNNARKVRPSNLNDNRFQLAGISLYTVATIDENGIPLRGQPYNQTLERGFVQTGFTLPILARGIVTIKQSQVATQPAVTDIAVAGANGQVSSLTNNSANLIYTATGALAIGKFISSSGIAFNGYYQLKLEL